jgi:hypothetical protein
MGAERRISFNDDRSLDSRFTGGKKIYVNAQVDRPLPGTGFTDCCRESGGCCSATKRRSDPGMILIFKGWGLVKVWNSDLVRMRGRESALIGYIALYL